MKRITVVNSSKRVIKLSPSPSPSPTPTGIISMRKRGSAPGSGSQSPVEDESKAAFTAKTDGMAASQSYLMAKK